MTSNISFLDSVAQYFSNPGFNQPKLSDITFVLPNKRSAMFLKKAVRNCAEGVMMMPRFMTFRTFIASIAPYPEANDRELLFTLYDAYRNVMRLRYGREKISEFDAFIFWADMMISDFDDVDKALADPSQIFRNLRELKDMQADFLSPEQKEVIRKVWGESRLTTNIDGFWRHIGDNQAPGEMEKKFIYLWAILSDIYTEYHRLLNEAGKSSNGAHYRHAASHIDDIEKLDPDGTAHFVFVGFNDLSNAETIIFDKLKRLGVASFIWDTAPLTLASSDKILPHPLARLRSLIRNFPMPKDYECPTAEELPTVHVSSIPSKITQAKSLPSILRELIRNNALKPEDAINTAIILPDQGLLLPSLLSIPSEISKLNISMGLSFKSTTFADLIHAIISMQLRARKIGGRPHFFYEDISAVLSHPHIRKIDGEAADRVMRHIADNKLFNILSDTIIGKDMAPDFSPIFTVVKDLNNVDQVAAYLHNLLSWLNDRLMRAAEESGTPVQPEFELKALDYFRTQLNELAQLVRTHNVEMADHTFLHLFEKVFSARVLTLTGAPLQGLQLLGVLETRALDFDNVIILSMNEGVFPRKQYTRTMIPNNVRNGFALPDFDSLEWTYAYCFYRLIARAKNVHLLYDSASDGAEKNERSRYITQLQYLFPKLNIVFSELDISAKTTETAGFNTANIPQAKARLEGFKPGGRLRLSASALKAYRDCPFRFYLEYVCRMRTNDELVNYITAAEYGTITHNVIQALFDALDDKRITRQTYDNWLNPDNTQIDREVVRQLKAVHYRHLKDDSLSADQLDSEGRITAEIISKMVRNNLRAERNTYGNSEFTFVENEYKVNGVWKLSNGTEFNFYMSIDRVDRLPDGTLRFIDYKTGSDKIEATNLSKLFEMDSNKHDDKGILQLLVYSEAYQAMVKEGQPIMPSLHPLPTLGSADTIEPLLIEKEHITNYLDIRDKVRPLIENFIQQIFEESVPFTQSQDKDNKNCKYCKFLSLCGRTVKETW